MLNEKKRFQLFKLTKKSWVTSKLTTQQTKAAEEKDTTTKHYKPYVTEKGHRLWNTGRKNKVSKRPLDQ